MKITRKQLRQIIKEEILRENVLNYQNVNRLISDLKGTNDINLIRGAVIFILQRISDGSIHQMESVELREAVKGLK